MSRRSKIILWLIICLNLIISPKVWSTSISVADAIKKFDYNNGYENKKIRILAINSYHEGLQWTDDIMDGIKSVLDGDEEFHIEYLDTKRINDENYYEKIYELFRYKFQNSNFDVIIVSDYDALNFMMKYGDDLFGNIPVVFCGVNGNRDMLDELKPNMTGVVENLDIMETLDLAFDLHPKTKRVLVVSDENSAGRLNKEEVKLVEEKYDYIDFEVTEDMCIDNILDTASKMGKDDIIFMLSFTKDKKGNVYGFQEVSNLLDEVSDTPIYGTWDFSLGHGIVGGKLASGFYQGKNAGILARRIVSGERPEDIPAINASPNKYMFDYEELNEFNIDIEKLPKNSIIINRPYSFYEENKIIINITIAFIVSLILIILLLLTNIRDRRIAQREVDSVNKHLEELVLERTKELEDTNKELKTTLETLKMTQNQLIESEKMAALGNLVGGVAHEINTPVGIGVTAITHLDIRTKEMLKLLETGKLKKSDLDKYLQDNKDSAKLVLNNLNRAARLINSFKQVAVDQSNKEYRKVNIKKYTKDIILSLRPELKKTNIKVELNAPKDLEVKINPGNYSQVITNLVINSIRHGYKKEEDGKITIDIEEKEDKIIITHTDYGKGISKDIIKKIFDPFFTTARNQGGTGLGLNIIYNIVVQKMKGTIRCESELGEYTKFIVELGQSVVGSSVSS